MRSWMKVLVVFGVLVCNLPIVGSAQTDSLAATSVDTALAKRLLAEAKDLLGKGKNDEAEGKLNRAGAVFEKVLGKESLEYADVLHQMGRFWIQQGKGEKGFIFAQNALTIRLKLLPNDHPDIASSYSNLGIAHELMGNYKEALVHKEKALEISLKIYNESHSEVASAFHNLGVYYELIADYEKAIENYKKAFNIRNQVLTEKDSPLADSYDAMGWIFEHKGEYDESMKYYEKALKIRLQIFGENSNHPDVAISYEHIGIVYEYSGEYVKAISYKQKVLEIRKVLFGEEHLDVASAFSNLGVSYGSNGEYDKSIKCYEKALLIRRALLGEEHPDIATAYHNLAVSYYDLGEYDKAIEYVEKAINLRLKFLGENHLDVASSYNNLGVFYDSKAEYDKAIDYYERALGIRVSILGENHPDVGSSYQNLGTAYDAIGNYDNGIYFKRKALTTRLNTLGKNHPDVASSYDEIGSYYDFNNDYDKALEFKIKALKIRLELLGEDHQETMYSYNNLSISYQNMGEYAKAIEYAEKAIKLGLKLLGERHHYIAIFYQNLGTSYDGMGKYYEAIKYTEKALNIFFEKNPSDIADIYNNLGATYIKIDQYEKSKEYHEKALSLYLKQLGDEHPNVAVAHNNLGALYDFKGEYEPAIRHYSYALKALKYQTQNITQMSSIEELVRTLKLFSRTLQNQYPLTTNFSTLHQSLSYTHQALAALDYQSTTFTSESSKTYWQSENHPIYAQAIDISLLAADVNHNDTLRRQTFTYAEKSKATQLQAQLKNADALAFSGIPDSLTQKEYQLRVDLSWREKQRQALLDQGKAETDSTVLRISSILFDLRQQYDTLKTRFEKNYPEYYRLKYDLRTVPLNYVQDTLLQSGQTLIEYFVGDSSIYLFLVQPKNYEVIEIKKDTAFEQWVEDLTRNGIYGYYGKKGVSKGKSINNFGTASHQLYEALIAPVKAKLPKDEKLIIIPDGILGYVPFEALLTQKPPHPDAIAAYKYLIQDHQISYCYSASLLKEMRNKKHHQEPTQKLLAMAPFFLGNADTLLSQVDSTELIAGITLRDTLTALPNSGEEVARIHKILKGQALYGKVATLAQFQKLAAQARILHLSTHAEADNRLGDYAYLAFSMPNANGTFDKLYVRDLYNLSLNADMVVLSACETGIGKLQRGEGIVSLARAFAYAGAKSIVTTLWKVSDEQSKNLMISFYKYLSKGKDKDEALRLAKLDFLKVNEKRTELLHPFFWASFIGIGDMRKIN